MNEDGTKARGIIAVLAISALVALSGMLMAIEPPKGSKEVLLLVVGALIAFCADVKQFYFGSSSGAKTLVKNQQAITEQAVAAAAASTPATVVPSFPLVATPEGDRGPSAISPAEARERMQPPGFAEFSDSVRQINPDATDEAIAAAWQALQGGKRAVDVRV